MKYVIKSLVTGEYLKLIPPVGASMIPDKEQATRFDSISDATRTCGELGVNDYRSEEVES